MKNSPGAPIQVNHLLEILRCSSRRVEGTGPTKPWQPSRQLSGKWCPVLPQRPLRTDEWKVGAFLHSLPLPLICRGRGFLFSALRKGGNGSTPFCTLYVFRSLCDAFLTDCAVSSPSRLSGRLPRQWKSVCVVTVAWRCVVAVSPRP